MAWTAPRTWVSGEVVTAALLNLHLRDQLLALGDPTTWTAFTPTVTQSVGVAITSNNSRWIAVGKIIHAHYSFLINASGTATAGISITLPATAASLQAINGSGTVFYQDISGPTLYALQPSGASTSSFNMINVPAGTFGNNANVQAVAGDIVNATLVYEGA